MLAKMVVVHDQGIDQAAPEGLADDIRQSPKAEEFYGYHPAAPDKAHMLRLQRVKELEQIGFRLISKNTAGSRQISQSLEGTRTDELNRVGRDRHCMC